MEHDTVEELVRAVNNTGVFTTTAMVSTAIIHAAKNDLFHVLEKADGLSVSKQSPARHTMIYAPNINVFNLVFNHFRSSLTEADEDVILPILAKNGNVEIFNRIWTAPAPKPFSQKCKENALAQATNPDIKKSLEIALGKAYY